MVDVQLILFRFKDKMFSYIKNQFLGKNLSDCRMEIMYPFHSIYKDGYVSSRNYSPNIHSVLSDFIVCDKDKADLIKSIKEYF